MSVDKETLMQISHDLCTTMLGFVVADDREQNVVQEETILATVSITGDCDADVEVEASLRTAELIASAMFGLEISELSDTELMDAVGEVANIVGGNVKGMYAGESRLSIPTIVRRDNWPVANCTRSATTVRLTCNARPLAIRLCEAASVPA